MSTLTLIRHGQVANFETDGDRLSPKGEQQARALGEWWIRNGVEFDEVYSGTLGRHIATERVVAGVFTEHGRPWPPPEARAGWNEYDAHGVLRNAHRERVPRGDARAFQRMFEIAMLAWLEGETAEGVEPWPAFRDRVREELARIVGAGGGGRRVAVFTSGGPIGVAVQTAMAAPDRSFLELNWRVRNCSVTEFVFGGGRITLDSFNSVAHMGKGLHTWR